MSARQSTVHLADEWTRYLSASMACSGLERLAMSLSSAEAEELINELHPFWDRRLITKWEATLEAPVRAIRLVDLNGDGHDEILAVTDNYRITLHQFVPENGGKWLTQTSRLPEGITGPVVGIQLKEAGLQQKIAYIIVNHAKCTHSYELAVDSQGGLGIQLLPAPTSTRALLATTASRLENPHRVRLVQALIYPEKSRRCRYRIYGRSVFNGHEFVPEAVHTAPHRVFCLAYGDDGAFFAGSDERVHFLPYDQAEGKEWREDTTWTELARIASPVRALCLRRDAQGAEVLLVGSDDGLIRAFSVADRRLLWKQQMGAGVLSLAVGFSERAGAEDLAVGLRDGRWLLCAFAPDAGDGSTLAREVLVRCYTEARDACASEHILLRGWLNDPRFPVARFALWQTLCLLPNPLAVSLLEEAIELWSHDLLGKGRLLALTEMLEGWLSTAGQPDERLDLLLPVLEKLCQEGPEDVRHRLYEALSRAVVERAVLQEYDGFSRLREHCRHLSHEEGAVTAASRVERLRYLGRQWALTGRVMELIDLHGLPGSVRVLEPLGCEAAGRRARLLVAHGQGLDLLNPENGEMTQRQITSGPIRAVAVQRMSDDGGLLVSVAAEGDPVRLYLWSGMGGLGKPVATLQEEEHDVWTLAFARRHTVAGPSELVLLVGGGDGTVRSYNQQGDEWHLEPGSEAKVGEWVRHLIAVDLDGDGEDEALACEYAAPYLYALDTHNRKLQTFVFPSPLIQVRAYPELVEGRSMALALGADGILYAFDCQGRRLWSYYAGRASRGFDLCDMDQDGLEEILLAGSGGRVLVLDPCGELKVSFEQGESIESLRSVPGLDAPHLFIASRCHLLYQFQIIEPALTGLAVAEGGPEYGAILNEVGGDEGSLLQELLGSNDLPEIQAVALSRLARLVEAEPSPTWTDMAASFQLAGEVEESLQSAYWLAQQSIATHATRAGAATAAVKRLATAWMGGALSIETKIAGLISLRRSLTASSLARWQPLLKEAFRDNEVRVRREAIRVLRAAADPLARPEGGALFWSLLSEIPPDSPWLMEEVALILRDWFGLSFSDLLVSCHVALASGVPIEVLETLFTEKAPLIVEADIRAVVQALTSFLKAPTEELVQATQSLCRAMRAASENGHLAADEIALIYRLLGELLTLGKEEELVSILGSPGQERQSSDLSAWLSSETQIDPLEPLWHYLYQVQEAIQVSHEGPLRPRDWQDIASKLDGLGARWQQEESGEDPLADRWRLLLVQMIQGWLDEETGVLGHCLREMATLPWLVAEIEGSPIREGDRLRTRITIANDGYVPALQLGFSHPCAQAGDQTLECQGVGGYERIRERLHPGERFTSSLAITLVPGVTDVVELNLPYCYLTFEGVEKEGCLSLPLTLSRSLGSLVDYPQVFPSSWQHYSRKLKDLASPGAIVLVECQRVARPSVLWGTADLFSQVESPYLDLRSAYFDSEPEVFQVTPGVIHRWLLEHLDSSISRERLQEMVRGELYTHTFYEVLERKMEGSRQQLLFFDNFDFLLWRFIRDPVRRATLQTMFDLWQRVVTNLPVTIILGGSYLAQKMLAERFKGFHSSLRVVRPDYLVEHGGGREEIVAFVQQRLGEQGLTDTLELFDPVSLGELVDLCGGSLHFLEYLVFDGLEVARQEEAEKPTGPGRRGNLVDYLVTYGHQSGFFPLGWATLSLGEKLAFSLVASAEYPIRSKKWLTEGMVLSRDYYSRAPSRRRSKLVLKAGTRLDDREIQKIRSSKYLQSGDVWIRGHWAGRGPSGESDGAVRMLLRLLESLGGEEIFRQSEEEEVFMSLAGPEGKGQVYRFRSPIFALWFGKSKQRERLLAAAQGEGTWFRNEDFCDKEGNLLYPDRGPEPLYTLLPLHVLSGIDDGLQPDDLPYFFNLYGMEQDDHHRQKRKWRALVGLARQVGTNGERSGALEMIELFGHLTKLLQLEPDHSSMQPSRMELRVAQDKGPNVSRKVQLWWQRCRAPALFRGFSPEMVLIWVPDSEMAMAVLPAIQERIEQEVFPPDAHDSGDQDPRQVALFVIPTGAEAWQAKFRDEPVGRWKRVRSAALGPSELGAVIAAKEPKTAVLEFCRRQVGRYTFSPYRTSSPVPPDSRLFVGRRNEVDTITQNIHRQDFVIVGSRRIGKTSLLDRVKWILSQETEKYNIFSITLQGTTDAKDFFSKIRGALWGQGYGKEAAASLQDDPESLRRLLARLYRQEGRMAVFLIDEIDGFYDHDFRYNNQHFFSFLRSLCYTEPRNCAFVMTGCAEIFLWKFDPRSVFYNFGRFLNIAEIDPPSAKKLIRLMEDYRVRFAHPSIVERLAQVTYHIPWVIQTACDQLLLLLDRQQRDELTENDIETVVTHQLIDELRRMLMGQTEVSERAYADQEYKISQEIGQARSHILLLATVLGKYPEKELPAYAHRQRLPEQRYFTVADVLGYLQTWAGEIYHLWPWMRDQVERLLIAQTMTLAVAPSLDGRAFYFPQDILPDVLFQLHHDHDSGYNIIDDLGEQLSRYRRLVGKEVKR